MGFSFFFFFQAEDGIRDGTVTGVQTCALPIWTIRHPAQSRRRRGSLPWGTGTAVATTQTRRVSAPAEIGESESGRQARRSLQDVVSRPQVSASDAPTKRRWGRAAALPALVALLVVGVAYFTLWAIRVAFFPRDRPSFSASCLSLGGGTGPCVPG